MAEENLLPLTMQNGLPTPVLLRGVERRVALQVDVNELEGRPHGLYGRAFASSPPDAIRKAARILTPPQDVNLICMAAPKPASGTYTAEQLRLILLTALSAFTAAKVDSNTAFPGEDRITIIHTGHWGTGAYVSISSSISLSFSLFLARSYCLFPIFVNDHSVLPSTPPFSPFF
jgi:hypothetical protein